MSAPKVDVLAVMDALIHVVDLHPTTGVRNAKEARAAVAELINATRRALAYSDHICDTEHGGKRKPGALEHYNRMQAALARIDGAE